MLRLRSSMLGAALLLAPLCAQGSILPYLPKDTALVVTVPDVSASLSRFSSLPLPKMWAEEDVQNFVADALAFAKAKIDEGMAQAKQMHEAGQLPVDPDKVMQLRVNGGTFAVTSLAMTEGQMGPLPKIGLMVYVDFGATAPQWFELLQMGMGMLEMQAGAKLTKEETVVGDCKLTTLIPNGAPPGMEMSINIAMTKTGLLIGTLQGEVKGVLENMQKSTPMLAATDGYKANMQHLDTAATETELFMRPGAFVEFGMDALGIAASHSDELAAIDMDGIRRAIDALGLHGVKSLGVTSSYQNGKCVTKSYAVAPAAARKGLLAGNNKNLDTSFLKWVPKDAVAFSGMTLEPMSIYDALVNALKAYDPQMAEMALGHLAQMESELGFSIRDDLFASLGDTLLSWSMPMGAITSAPEVAILMKVNDQDKIVKVLKGIAALTQGTVEIEESEKRGVKSYSLRLNVDPGMGMNFLDMFTPTFSFKDGWLVGGFSASDIKRTFARMEREDDPKGDIRGNKEFAALASQLPENIASVSFTDWKAQFEAMYQMATGVLAFVPISDEIPIDMSQLPEAGTLTKHLFGSITYSQVDGNGFSSTTVSPFGPEVALGAAALIVAGIGVAGSMRAFR